MEFVRDIQSRMDQLNQRIHRIEIHFNQKTQERETRNVKHPVVSAPNVADQLNLNLITLTI